MRDHGTLYLRTATVLAAEAGPVRVILSEPLDKEFVDKIAGDLGRIAVYGNRECDCEFVRSGAAEPLGALPWIR